MDKKTLLVGGLVATAATFGLVYIIKKNKADKDAKLLLEQRTKEQAAQTLQQKQQLTDKSKYVLDYYDKMYKDMTVLDPAHPHHDTLGVKKIRDLIQNGVLNNDEIDALTDMIKFEKNEYLGKKTKSEIHQYAQEKVFNVWLRSDNDKQIIKT